MSLSHMCQTKMAMPGVPSRPSPSLSFSMATSRFLVPFTTRWNSIIYTTSPWHLCANTSCSWPYVCVSWADGSVASTPDWINFRCGVCRGLLHWVHCDIQLPLQPPCPSLATKVSLSTFLPNTHSPTPWVWYSHTPPPSLSHAHTLSGLPTFI